MVLRALVATGLVLFLAHVLTSFADDKQVAARTLHQDAQRESDDRHEFSLLDQHLSSVLQLLAQAQGRGDERWNNSTDTMQLRDMMESLDNFVTSMITAPTSLGIVHIHDLEDPLAASLVNALSKRIPAKQQDVSRLMRNILAGLHKLLGPAGHSHGRSDSETFAGNSSSNGIGSTTATGSAVLGMVPERSYPLLRRATVARLTQLWALHLRSHGTERSESGFRSGSGLESGSGSEPSAWARATWREMARALLMLFQLHRAGMASRPALEFMHISKAAGTSMCRLAEATGCRAQDFSMGRTCLMRDFDDQPRWINGSHHWKLIARVAQPGGPHPYAFLLYGVPRHPRRKRTCPARRANLEKYGLNFFANEYTIYNILTAYREAPVEEDADVDAAVGGKSPPSPRAPPSPPSPPSPPLSVVFEETAERYADFVSQLVSNKVAKATDVERAWGNFGGVSNHRGILGSSILDSSNSSNSSRSLRSSSSGSRHSSSGSSSRSRSGSSSWSIGSSSTSGSSSSSNRSASIVMAGAHLCPFFSNVIVLRDPAERFMSHLKFIAQTYATMYEWPSIVQAFAPGRDSATWWRAFVPPLFDNYMLRTLGGEAIFTMSYDDLEAGAASYMALARVMLAQYDVILVIEAGEVAHRRAVHYGLAWHNRLSEFQLRNSSSLLKKLNLTQFGSQLAMLLPNETLLAQLQQNAIRHDSNLHSHGALLAGLDDVVWGMAEAALGEPLPEFWNENGTRCGYVRTPQRPPAAPARPPTPPAPPSGPPSSPPG